MTAVYSGRTTLQGSLARDISREIVARHKQHF
jgi:hypothetical protein